MRDRIMVIESDPEDRSRLALLLTQEDYDVTAVDDDCAAEAVISSRQDTDSDFDAIISSATPPGNRGMLTCLSMETRFGTLPLVFLAEEGASLDVASVCGKPILQKPVSGTELAQAVRDAISGQKRRRTQRILRKALSEVG